MDVCIVYLPTDFNRNSTNSLDHKLGTIYICTEREREIKRSRSGMIYAQRLGEISRERETRERGEKIREDARGISGSVRVGFFTLS